MKMEINGVQTELSVEEFVKLSEILEGKTEDTKEVTGYEIARKLIDELIEEEEGNDKEPENFSVGDVVLVNDSIDDVGAIITVVEDYPYPYKVEYFRTGFIGWCDSSELHKLEGEELAEYNRDHIEEGDIVVITANTTSSRNQVGDIGKISVIEPYGVYVDVPERPHTVGCSGNGTAYGEFRLATEDEREQYEELTDETQKHTIEVGDIVQVTEDEGGHLVGTIGVVTRYHGGDDVIVTTVKTDSSGDILPMTYYESNVKLIAKHYDRKDV